MTRDFRRNDIFSLENRWFAPLFAELTLTNFTHFALLAILAVYLNGNLGFGPGDTALLLAVTSLGLRGSASLSLRSSIRFPSTA